MTVRLLEVNFGSSHEYLGSGFETHGLGKCPIPTGKVRFSPSHDSVEIIQIVRSWRTVGCNLTMTKMASRPQIYADGVKEDGVLSHDIGREAEIITFLQATGE